MSAAAKALATTKMTLPNCVMRSIQSTMARWAAPRSPLAQCENSRMIVTWARLNKSSAGMICSAASAYLTVAGRTPRTCALWARAVVIMADRDGSGADARLRAEAPDAANRKRGRRSSVLAGAEGVEEPTKKKTLIGS